MFKWLYPNYLLIVHSGKPDIPLEQKVISSLSILANDHISVRKKALLDILAIPDTVPVIKDRVRLVISHLSILLLY